MRVDKTVGRIFLVEHIENRKPYEVIIIIEDRSVKFELGSVTVIMITNNPVREKMFSRKTLRKIRLNF